MLRFRGVPADKMEAALAAYCAYCERCRAMKINLRGADETSMEQWLREWLEAEARGDFKDENALVRVPLPGAQSALSWVRVNRQAFEQV